MKKTTIVSRAHGALLGQLVGDALAGAVAGWPPEQIQSTYPDGVREMLANDELGTIPGQLTDSEMALVLARCIVEHAEYDLSLVRAAYLKWLETGTSRNEAEVRAGVQAQADPDGLSNVALLRVVPIGVYGARLWSGVVELWAREDCMLTHPNPVCLAANELFASAVASAVNVQAPPQVLFEHLRARAEADEILADTVKRARTSPPHFVERPELVVVALQNALYQLVNATSFEDAIIDTICRGGDTVANAAVCGALMGAVYGREAIPRSWARTVLTCEPKAGKKGVARPRPEEYWPADALDLAEKLVSERPLEISA